MINSTHKEEEISDSKKRRLQRKQFKKDQKNDNISEGYVVI